MNNRIGPIQFAAQSININVWVRIRSNVDLLLDQSWTIHLLKCSTVYSKSLLRKQFVRGSFGWGEWFGAAAFYFISFSRSPYGGCPIQNCHPCRKEELMFLANQFGRRRHTKKTKCSNSNSTLRCFYDIVAQSSGSRSVTNSLLSQELKLCFSDTKFTKAPDTKLTKAPETKRYQIISKILNEILNINVKNVHPVYGVGVQTHDLPYPLDKGSGPVFGICYTLMIVQKL